MKGNRQRVGVIVSLLIVVSVCAIIAIAHSIRTAAQNDPNSVGSIIISIFESAALVGSLIYASAQLIASKDIAHATFITELNKAFVENSDYTDVYNHLQNCVDKCCDCENPCADKNDLETGNCTLPITKGQISNYLTFFETIYILNKKGVIDFDTLNDLFAYRFFLAVHSKIFQQQKLGLQPENFKNIFCLERLWLNYRKAAKEIDDKPNTVYGRLLLKELVDEKTYESMTEECIPKLIEEKEKADASVQK
jgi:hypothetical protein